MSSICSCKADFRKHFVDMKLWFQARGYPSDLIQKEINKVNFSGHWDKNRAKKKSKGVPLVINFHPLLKDVGNIIHKDLYLLYKDQEAQRGFTLVPMINVRSARKLSSYLVRLHYTHQKGLLAPVNVMVNDVQFVIMLQKHRFSLAPQLKIPTK